MKRRYQKNDRFFGGYMFLMKGNMNETFCFDCTEYIACSSHL